MEFKEILKNPGKAFWSYLDNLKNKPPVTNNETSPNKISLGAAIDNENPVAEVTEFVEKAKKKDWSWLLKGKFGLFLTITGCLLLVLILIEPFIVKRSPVSVKEPEIVDPGDSLEKPNFEEVNYLNGVYNEGNFLLYSPKINQINEIGSRGIVLSSINTENVNPYYFPISKDSYIYLNGTSLYFFYIDVKEIITRGVKEIVREPITLELLNNVSSINDIQNLHKTPEGNVVFTLQTNVENVELVLKQDTGETVENKILTPVSTLIALNNRGEKLIDYNIDRVETSLYTYLSNEIYFIQNVNENYYLKKLNPNLEEILNINLGTYKPHRMYILNNNRFLIVFEQPSEQTFFYVKMIDSTGNTFFNFTPKEEVKKFTEITSITFDPEDNQVLMVGTDVAKLFSVTGEQLWIR